MSTDAMTMAITAPNGEIHITAAMITSAITLAPATMVQRDLDRRWRIIRSDDFALIPLVSFGHGLRGFFVSIYIPPGGTPSLPWI